MQKLRKAQCFMKRIYEYEMKSFSETLNLIQIFQKQDFQSVCP